MGRVRIGTGTKSQAGFTLLAQEPIIVPEFSLEKRFRAPTELLEHEVRSGATGNM